MPFAPMIRDVDAKKILENYSSEDYSSRFMTITYNCREKFIKNHPAVVHIDGTARPQIISKNDNPEYYEVVKKYCNMSGDSALINTSFNLHEEPIVCFPIDAIKSLIRGAIDILIIGNYQVVLKNKN